MVVQDEKKGRCLESVRPFNVGDIIFEEDALVFAKSSFRDEGDSSHHELEEILLRAYGKSHIKMMDQYHEELANFDQIQCLDTARCLLQLVALHILQMKSSYPVDQIPDCSNKMNMLMQLGVSSVEANAENISAVRQFRSLYPKLIPKTISDSIVGKFLGILKTNQHELEDIEGSGLFVLAAIMEHNCNPNCSFTTHNNHMFVTAIKPIKPNERLSIDYSNDFYSPTAHRREYLQETYGFQCDCSMCLGPDRKRSFVCPECPSKLEDSIIFPIGNDDSKFNWSVCSICGYKGAPEYLQHCLDRESYYLGAPPLLEADVDSIIAEGILEKSHYLLFAALDEVAVKLSVSARRACNKAAYLSAIKIQQRVISILNSSVMPNLHHEKVLMYDKLGQLAVAAGEQSLAKSSFRKAFEISRLTCGDSVPITQNLYILSEETPVSIQELISKFKASAFK